MDLPRRTKGLIIGGSLLAMFMAALEQSVVNPAMPRIVSDLGGLELYPWLVQSFIMAQVLAIPASGALGDVIGRKPVLMSGMVIFLLGSALCGAAGGIYELIAFRAVQGVGAAFLMTSTFSVVGDLFPPSERGKYIGLFGGVFALSGLIGAPLGGVLTDALSWRWVFWIMLIAGPPGLLVVGLKMPWLRPPPKPFRFDYAGLAVLTVALLPAMIALSLASDWGWLSAPTLGLFAVSLVGLALFLRVERRAEQPIVPMHLFRIPTVAGVAIATFFIGLGMMGVMVYMQFYLQVGLGWEAVEAGAVMGPMIVIAVMFSVVSGQIMSRTGRYKALAVIGSILMLLGLVALSTMSRETTAPGVLGRLFLFGVGMGLMMPVLTLAAQNAAPQKYLGIVSAFTQFFQQVGGVIGIGVIGAVFNAALASGLASSLREDLVAIIEPEKLVDPIFRDNLIEEIGAAAWAVAEPQVQTAVATAITDNFLIAIGVMAVALLVIVRMKEVRLRTGAESGPGRAAQPIVAPRPEPVPPPPANAAAGPTVAQQTRAEMEQPPPAPVAANGNAAQAAPPPVLAPIAAPQAAASLNGVTPLNGAAAANGVHAISEPAEPASLWATRVAATAFVGASVGLAVALAYRRRDN